MAPVDDASPLAQALQGLVSPDILDFLHKTALHPRSPVQLFVRQGSSLFQKGTSAAYAFAEPYVDSAFDALMDSPEIVSLAVFVMLFAAVWIVLGWMRRLVSFVTRLFFGALFWGLVGVIVMFVMKHGVLESATEAARFAGKIWGLMMLVKDVWVGELRRYEDEARQGRR
ncbi:hypothetical protein F5X68DRAFT_277275 [Plectosphaerella plurivora]|uniref:Uncharacterized protein n=1 Tax=Plectosphaerella plurivora TaxID=936078 RepID=A0A9P9A6J4_9PEZI|nr:hypothetical protein F5X68DRAFT_277275 [Plectosphaerella plurivora]